MPNSEIQKECNIYVDKNEQVDTGDAAITGAGLLKNRGIEYILHAVGPVWGGGNNHEREDLKSCVKVCLTKFPKKFKSISIPAISSGIFGFPKEECAKIMIDTSFEVVESGEAEYLEEIRLTNFDQPTVGIFKEEMERKIRGLTQDKEGERGEKREEIDREKKEEGNEKREDEKNDEKLAEQIKERQEERKEKEDKAQENHDSEPKKVDTLEEKKEEEQVAQEVKKEEQNGEEKKKEEQEDEERKEKTKKSPVPKEEGSKINQGKKEENNIHEMLSDHKESIKKEECPPKDRFCKCLLI